MSVCHVRSNAWKCHWYSCNAQFHIYCIATLALILVVSLKMLKSSKGNCQYDWIAWHVNVTHDLKIFSYQSDTGIEFLDRCDTQSNAWDILFFFSLFQSVFVGLESAFGDERKEMIDRLWATFITRYNPRAAFILVMQFEDSLVSCLTGWSFWATFILLYNPSLCSYWLCNWQIVWLVAWLVDHSEQHSSFFTIPGCVHTGCAIGR